jgi:hypothetical protein
MYSLTRYGIICRRFGHRRVKLTTTYSVISASLKVLLMK